MLELEDESGADRLDDCRCAPFLSRLDVVDVSMLVRVDERDGPAAGYRRDLVREQLLAGDEHSRRPRSSDHLVRGEEHGVLVCGRVVLGAHVDRHVRGRGCEVPERKGVVLVKQPGDGPRVGDDSSDVGCRGEATDLQRSISVLLEGLFELGKVDMTIGVLFDAHHVGDRLPPRAARSSDARMVR